MSEAKKRSFLGGCLSKLLVLVLLAVLGGVGAAIWFAVQAQDLSDLGGHGAAMKANPPRDMKVVLQNALDRNFVVTLSEAEINQWIAATLAMRQGGVLAKEVTLDHFRVRLEDGRAELILVRTVFGKPFTVSMYFQVDKEQRGREIITSFNPSGGSFLKDYEFPRKGGRLGKLVVPQGFLHLLMPSFSKIAALYEAETELAFTRMQRVRIEEERLVLDPRELLGEEGMPETF